ncbi:DUF4331 family protein [Novosphingobium sp. Gsoil 351]|uniref:DUF4331 family protein n=1 Tax=Novosphingobium sp. Gsoil 351 TaxID=2675225 RepID=UPI0018A85476|nr:DUF4331 family protein [Novosphingobium sp. Gsoil 351]
MQLKRRLALGAAVVAVAGAAMVLVPGQLAWSADHLDPPARTDPAVDTTPDTPADIADLYAFSDATNAYFAISFAGPQVAGVPAFYDRDVLYNLNISTSAPATSADVGIRFRFGPATNGTGSGISVENVPGVNGAIVGPVEQILSKDGVRVYAGLRDDPFFFDLQGFKATRASGTLMFDKTRNFFANKNDTVFVIEIPKSRLGGNTNSIDVWTTTSRFGGQL